MTEYERQELGTHQWDVEMGAVVGWCSSKILKEYSLRILYWKKIFIKQLKSLIEVIRFYFYTVGFVDNKRGRHWNRKRLW